MTTLSDRLREAVRLYELRTGPVAPSSGLLREAADRLDALEADAQTQANEAKRLAAALQTAVDEIGRQARAQQEGG